MIPIEVITMKDKQTLIYWVDLTGPAVLDEIVRLTIVDINNNITSIASL